MQSGTTKSTLLERVGSCLTYDTGQCLARLQCERLCRAAGLSSCVHVVVYVEKMSKRSLTDDQVCAILFRSDDLDVINGYNEDDVTESGNIHSDNDNRHSDNSDGSVYGDTTEDDEPPVPKRRKKILTSGRLVRNLDASLDENNYNPVTLPHHNEVYKCTLIKSRNLDQ